MVRGGRAASGENVQAQRFVVSWRERDYSRHSLSEYRRYLGGWRRCPARLVLTLLHLAGAVLVLLAVNYRDVAELLELARLQPLWSGPFLTDSGLAVVITCAGLWFVGGRVEGAIGPARLVTMYVLGAVFAAGAFAMVQALAPAWARMSMTLPVGPLAAISLRAWRHGRREIVPVFAWLVPYGTILATAAAVAVGLLLVGRGLSAAAWIAALLAGLLADPACDALVSMVRDLRRRATRARPRRRERATPEPMGAGVPLEVAVESAAEPDIDDVLAKISREGIASLSSQERAKLESARQAKLRQSPYEVR